MKIRFDSPPASAEESNGVPVKYDAAKRQVPKWRWYLVLGIVLLIPLYFLYNLLSATMLRASPGMVVVDQLVMRAPITGQVQEIASEGDAAAQGQRLVRVVQNQVPVQQASAAATPAASGTPADQAYAAQRRELQGQQGALQASLQAAQGRSTLMAERVRQLESLQRQGAATRQEVDGARMQQLQVQGEVSAVQRDMLAASQQQSALQLQSVKDAAASRNAAGLTQMNTSTPEAELVAPLPVEVARSFVKSGEWVVAGDELLVLKTEKAPWIQAYLTPQQMKFARKGQKATLVFMDGRKVPAEVEEVLSETQRIPAERVGPMEAQGAAVVAKLRPLEPLQDEHRVNRLPIDVRFATSWWPGSEAPQVARSTKPAVAADKLPG